MNTILRITLLISFLIISMSNVNALVHNYQDEVKTNIIKKEKNDFIKKQLKNKFKKGVKSVKIWWKSTKESKKKRFGLIGSITAFVLLSTAALTTLQLTGLIAWSWFWVLSPLIFYAGLIFLGIVIALAVVLALKGANE